MTRLIYTTERDLSECPACNTSRRSLIQDVHVSYWFDEDLVESICCGAFEMDGSCCSQPSYKYKKEPKVCDFCHGTGYVDTENAMIYKLTE